jgi:biotin carboxylase
MIPRVLLVATTTGYQTRAFGDAAEALGIELVLATDRCAVLDDPWRDAAIPVRFHEPEASLDRVRQAARERPFAGVLAVGDRPAAFAARVQAALGLPGHPPDAAEAARSKLRTRERLRDAGLLVPSFTVAPAAVDAASLAARAVYPLVLKPLSLSGSRGVMRIDSDEALAAALERLRRLLSRPDVRAERDPAHELVLLESFIPGHEYALEGLMSQGRLTTLAVFDKPDPLDGPFFEESIYVTVPEEEHAVSAAIADAVVAAATALGLRHGAVHAECRVNDRGVYVLEVAARPIGGICARALRFVEAAGPDVISLEALLLRHAIGEAIDGWTREPAASGVMMIPIPKRGFYRDVSGIDAARRVAGVVDIVITARPDQLMMPLPEGASYLGFIFARGESRALVEQALRDAHAQLSFTIDPEVPMLQSAHG